MTKRNNLKRKRGSHPPQIKADCYLDGEKVNCNKGLCPECKTCPTHGAIECTKPINKSRCTHTKKRKVAAHHMQNRSYCSVPSCRDPIGVPCPACGNCCSHAKRKAPAADPRCCRPLPDPGKETVSSSDRRLSLPRAAKRANAVVDVSDSESVAPAATDKLVQVADALGVCSYRGSGVSREDAHIPIFIIAPAEMGTA